MQSEYFKIASSLIDMMYHTKQNESSLNFYGDLSLDWEDPCLGAANYSYPAYYVQSPAASRDCNVEGGKSPKNSDPFIRPSPFSNTVDEKDQNMHTVCMNALESRRSHHHEDQLSRYTGSKNSLNDDMKAYKAWMSREPIEEEEEEDDETDEPEYSLFPRGTFRGIGYQSNFCICLQLFLWFFVFLGVFTLLFTLATRPPSPVLLVKRIEFQQLRIGQGSDKSGVPTKVFSCNCNVTLDLDNRSEFFGLHLRRARITMSFADLTLATGHGRHLYVDRDSTMTFNVNIAARRKAVYGAGPSMAHLVQSADGLPLVMHIDIESSIRVLWNVVNPTFSQRVVCQIAVNGNNPEHRLELVKRSCIYQAL